MLNGLNLKLKDLEFECKISKLQNRNLNWKTEPFPGQLFTAFFHCFGSKGNVFVSSLKALKGSQLQGMSHGY
jgi:hypothetical protein